MLNNLAVMLVRPTAQTPRRPKGAGGGEERAGQARATMHAPFKRQVERKMTPGEGLFSLRLPKAPPCCSPLRPQNAKRNPCRSCTLATPQLRRELSLLRRFGQIARNPRQNARILIPTDSAGFRVGGNPRNHPQAASSRQGRGGKERCHARPCRAERQKSLVPSVSAAPPTKRVHPPRRVPPLSLPAPA
jgi:hypothetical protein